MKVILLRKSDIQNVETQVKDYFKTTIHKTYNSYVKKIKEDFEPIRIKDDELGERYVLPLTIKDHPMFSKLKEIVEKGNYKVITLTKADDASGDGINEPIYTKK
jgi:hypothetical protein